MAAKKKTTRSARAKAPPASRPAPSAPGAFPNRIVGEGFEDPHKLRANPLNWRVHTKIQREAQTDVLRSLGWIQRVIVNRRTGNIVDGHLRVELAIEEHEPQVPVLYVDLSAAEERMALTTIDPLSELAATDPEKLHGLLGQLERPNDGPLADLLNSLEQQVDGAVLKDVHEGTTRTPGNTAGTVLRMVMSVGDINTVERAIARTGQHNRGEAFVLICRAYLHAAERPAHDSHDQEGQHDAHAEGELTGGLEEAFAAGAGSSA